jgi:hypothetical protein
MSLITLALDDSRLLLYIMQLVINQQNKIPQSLSTTVHKLSIKRDSANSLVNIQADELSIVQALDNFHARN